jgi:hypothetical protein
VLLHGSAKTQKRRIPEGTDFGMKPMAPSRTRIKEDQPLIMFSAPVDSLSG